MITKISMTLIKVKTQPRKKANTRQSQFLSLSRISKSFRISQYGPNLRRTQYLKRLKKSSMRSLRRAQWKRLISQGHKNRLLFKLDLLRKKLHNNCKLLESNNQLRKKGQTLNQRRSSTTLRRKASRMNQPQKAKPFLCMKLLKSRATKSWSCRCTRPRQVTQQSTWLVWCHKRAFSSKHR